ncbi:DUF2059 domain-containing protein [Psychroflexus halocasei]|uniref:DUF2059 domain-containing protein n=1 Tax=Psychroflexus halocasei TaxID=908615 RepID=A0A1H3WR24_9FLAO|nr:DUF2059 domain-containing protein [Psychroflexus halocasei]SDZ89400.1 hypothetical protein SAMN05421540_102102 [Psychroflexus halocasei]
MKKITLILFLMVASIAFAQDQKTEYEKDAIELVKLSNNSVEVALEPIYSTLEETKREEFKKEIQPVLENMYQKFSKMYMEEFSHEDIKGILKFYDSELGKKLLDGQAEVMKKSMAIGQEFSMEVMPIYQKYMQN